MVKELIGRELKTLAASYGKCARFCSSEGNNKPQSWKIIEVYDWSGFFGSIPVCVPSTTFQVKGARGHDFFCFIMAFRAFNFFGAHLDKLLGHRTFLAFKLVHRHFLHPNMLIC